MNTVATTLFLQKSQEPMQWWNLPEVWWIFVGILLLLLEMLRPRRNSASIAKASIFAFAVMLIASLGWPTGLETTFFGGAYQWDGLAIFFKRIFLIAGLATTWMMRKCEAQGIQGRDEFYILPWFAVAAMGFVSSVGDFVTGFVSIELLTVCSYIMVAFYRSDRFSLEAGAKYLVIGALSTAFLVFGITILFGTGGSLRFDQLANSLASGHQDPAVTMGVVLVLVGVGFKLAAAPFHWWAPDVYHGAPTPVSAFLAVASKAAAVVFLLRLLIGPFAPLWTQCQQVLLALAGASLLVGNLGALSQRDVKRVMGYSSVSHAGFILLGISAGSQPAMLSVCYYLLAYTLATLLVFGVICGMIDKTGGSLMRQFNGLAQSRPGVAWLMTIGMLSLAGIPPLSGFFGKWFIFASVWQEGMYVMVFLAGFTAVASLFYYLAIVRHMFFEKPADGRAISSGLSFGYQLLLVVLAVATVAVGLVPGAVQRAIYALIFNL